MKLFEDNVITLPFKIPEKDGYSWEYDESSKSFHIDIPDGKLIYVEHYLNKKYSDYIMDFLLKSNVDWRYVNWRTVKPEDVKWENIHWRHDSIKLYGKQIPLPRYSAWYGDFDKPYTYSGLTLQPNLWNKGLNYLKAEISKLANTEFNSVLLNWYRDGSDYISWHTDAEKELGKNPIIGSVNFGATRRFLLRRIDDKNEKIELSLKHGTFLIMAGKTQHYWQHSVPKQVKVDSTRINLTFRVINHD